MAAHLVQAPLTFLPAPDLVTGTNAINHLLRAPHNVRLDRVLRRSSADAWLPSPSSVRCRAPFAMVEDAAGAALLLALYWGNLLEILTVENGGP